MLNLINNKIVPDPEILTIPEFKNLWSSDKTEEKEFALQAMGYIYFKHNPKSDYLKHSEGRELDSLLKKDIFLDAEIKLSDVVLKAESYYADKMETLNFKALKSAQSVLSRISIELDNLKFEEIDDVIKRMDIMAKSLSVVEKIDVATLKLASAIKKVQEEQASNLKNRKELSRFEKPRNKR